MDIIVYWFVFMCCAGGGVSFALSLKDNRLGTDAPHGFIMLSIAFIIGFFLWPVKLITQLLEE